MTMTIRPVSTIEFIGLSETNTIGYIQRVRLGQPVKTVKVGSLRANVQVECLVDVIADLMSSDEPQDKLKRFTKALHEVFAFGRSKKHMIQRQLGRLEPTPALTYRVDEVMRNIPVKST
jgi:hypothetical protein